MISPAPRAGRHPAAISDDVVSQPYRNRVEGDPVSGLALRLVEHTCLDPCKNDSRIVRLEPATDAHRGEADDGRS